MVRINYYYRSRRAISPLTVRIRFMQNEKRLCIEAKTQRTVKKDYWDKYHNNNKIRDHSMRVMKNEINKHLNDLSSFLNEAYSNADPVVIDKEWLEKQISFYYNPDLQKNIPLDLLGYISFYLDFRKNSVGPETVKKYRTLEKKIRAFIKVRAKNIMLKDIDENFKLEFENFQIEEQYSTSTVHRDIVFLKSLCIHANEQGLNINRQALKMKTKKEDIGDKNVIHFNLDELKKVKSLTNLSDHLELTRQWLIISCFTGQRISDFMRFNNSMIKVNGHVKILEIRQQKGKKNICIPMHKPVEEILNKNGGNFPKKMSHQKYNDHLKTLCKISGFDEIIFGKKMTKVGHKKFRKIPGNYPKYELVSSHIGRRSYATMFYMKMPLPVLMNITGHSSEAMLLRYIGVSPSYYALQAHKGYDLDF